MHIIIHLFCNKMLNAPKNRYTHQSQPLLSNLHNNRPNLSLITVDFVYGKTLWKVSENKNKGQQPFYSPIRYYMICTQYW